MESHYLHISPWHKTQRRKQGKGNFLYVRYADDFVVLCNGTKAEAQNMQEELRIHLDNMGRKLSEEKTKITHRTEGFAFLGYRIEKSIGETGKMVPKVLIPENAITRFRHKIREITCPRTSKESISAKILALNSLTRGWCQYYAITSSPSKEFNRLNPGLYWGLAHWLGRKYKTSIQEVIKRFGKEHTFGTIRVTLKMPGEYKAKKRLGKTWHNPYTKKEEVRGEKERIKRESLFSYDKLWTGPEDRHGWRDLREEAILLKGTTCNLCGTTLHPSEVEVDHITLRAKFKDPTEADSMANLQILCTPCHRAKTKTDLKVLSRMR
jgi:5-methylcytosine-specific restriction endonuclease McrA